MKLALSQIGDGNIETFLPVSNNLPTSLERNTQIHLCDFPLMNINMKSFVPFSIPNPFRVSLHQSTVAYKQMFSLLYF